MDIFDAKYVQLYKQLISCEVPQEKVGEVTHVLYTTGRNPLPEKCIAGYVRTGTSNNPQLSVTGRK